MKKVLYLRVLIIIVLILSAIIMSYYFSKEKIYSKICFSENCFDIEIADSHYERIKGLMFKESLDENKGMLFVFDKSYRHGIWMKNMNISLDIIWLDENLSIIEIKENAQPCNSNNCEIYYPEKDALYVLEINSGISKYHNLTINSSGILF
jgi:hypothetical protein